MKSQIDSTVERVRAMIRTGSVSKARSPMSMSSTNMYGDSGYGADYLPDQYEHYRGRFYAGARLITSRLASQPVLVGRSASKGSKRLASRLIQKGSIPPNGIPSWLGDPDSIEILTRHPLAAAMKNPNRIHTQYNFWEMVAASIMSTGRGFIVATPSEREGRTWDLMPVPATWMTPIHGDGPFTQWSIRPPSSTEKALIVDDSQVSHSYFADPSNPIAAISPMAMVAKSVLSDEEISNAQYSEFKNGGVPRVALIAGDVMNETGFTDDPNRTSAARPVKLEPHQRQQIISWFQQQFAGTRKNGMPMVLDALIRDIKILSHKPSEMGFMDSASLTKEQIMQGIGVSEILTGNLSGVTRASGALAEQFFMDYCFNPIVNMISQSATKKFGPLFATTDDEAESLSVWIAPGIHRDTELDIEYLRLLIRSYAGTRNDVRDIVRQRFGGLERLEGFDDVIIPDKLEERSPDEDRDGAGRIMALNSADSGE